MECVSDVPDQTGTSHKLVLGASSRALQKWTSPFVRGQGQGTDTNGIYHTGIARVIFWGSTTAAVSGSLEPPERCAFRWIMPVLQELLSLCVQNILFDEI